MNTSIIVRNVHNVSFTSFENKKSPLIVFYKWSQYKNVPHDKLTTDMCTPFGFWNATSVTINKLDMLVYEQNKPVDCLRVFGIIFANVSQLHLLHCNITIVRSTYSSFCSSYFIDSLFGTAAFTTTLCYQGSLYLTNGKNIEITKSTIVGGIEVYESAIATISYCNVLLLINRYIGTLYISKSRNIDVSDIFVHSDVLGPSNGISIQHTNHTKMTNVTVSNCSGTGLGLDDYMICTNCFLSLHGISNSVKQLIFTNNSAGQGGDVVYGGRMESTCPIDAYNILDYSSCLSRFLEVSVINPKTLSPISSEPSRVCFCNKSGTPDCLPLSHPTVFSIYPGQKISVSAVVVGQNFGTVAGSVFAQFFYSKPTPQLDVRESAQEVQHVHCNHLVYTILSPLEDYHTVLILTAVKRSIAETNEVIIQPIIDKGRTDDESDNNLDTPVYVRVNLMPCPPGFLINTQKCDCNNQLHSLPDVACNIQYSTLQRRGLVWIGPLTDDNDTITDVVSSENCPLNYCKDEAVSFQLNASSAQCNYNHSGLVCGGCQPGLSLALGSAQCLKCSNEYLALLIPFALAGVVLVLFIKLLDLTVSRGLINGLIFYANIIKPSEYIFLPQNNTNPLTIFISWLNLDLGIETCFFSGLTAYGKAWLQFVFPFYIWAIAGLIIASARYSIRVARITGYNSVPVLATLFLLSYAKLLRTIITVMSYTIVDSPQGSKAVWSADGNIDYLGPKHAPLFVAALATLLFLWLPYTLLLLLGQWLRRFDNRLLTRMLMKIKPFLDAHYGPLKDKHYYWFGALLFIRIVILLISAVVPANNFSVFTLSISVSAGALVVFTSIGPAVYRSKVTSVFETALFINLALLGLAKFYVYIAGGNQTAVTYLLISVAFAQFLGLVMYRAFSVLKPFFSKYHKRLINNNTADEGEDDDEEREGVWRFETSLPLQEIPRLLATPYENVSTAVH